MGRMGITSLIRFLPGDPMSNLVPSSGLAAVLSVVAAGLLWTQGCAGPSEGAPAVAISDSAVDAHIRYLSSDEMKGRDPLTEDIRLAESYIAEQFRAAGLSEFPGFPGYFQEFTYEYRPRREPEAEPTAYTFRNVVGYLEGTDPELKDEFILIGAHHDHIGVRGSEGDTIYNGADDNATGATAVLALAEYYARVRTNKRSIIFATFTAEERGLVGSRHLASHLPIGPDQLLCMINFEMIGKPAPDGSWSLMVLGPSLSTLDEIFREALDPDSPVTLVDPLEHQVRYYRGSDNAAFDAQGFITTTLASPNSTDDVYYHQPNDHYEFLDVAYMAEVIRAVVDMAEPLVMGQATPERTGSGEPPTP